ncbi:polysaccharide deacetylase family protein [Paenibacillus beijingensis]|uniref:Polysaccharide deacetylase n=1 Tax=Paenibacillus beijingensis TaxID=1126833 RepID=A0A0D5NNY3_9BACL|nr:polysaccharide deacetylase family protein [Paenibacillus beijingensis]AJY76707.1 polysaccharide deacetylase [Paenibacillus beijingensis]
MTKIVRYAALTFDDGPSPYTSKILKILKKYDIRATFFVVGQELHKYPKTIARMFREGHVIGNHTWDHPNLTKLHRSEMESQMIAADAEIAKLTGYRPGLFRPPSGYSNEEVLAVVHALGMTSVLWNVDSRDWDLSDYVPIHARILDQLKPQSLILLHDGDAFGCGPREAVLESLPVLIESLFSLEYRFVTVPEFHKLVCTIERHEV